jgi:hypothetical protein
VKKNIGPTDRIIRLILGVIIIIIGAIFNSLWGLVGVLVFLTGIIGWCGLYKLFGISTCKIKDQETPPQPQQKENDQAKA